MRKKGLKQWSKTAAACLLVLAMGGLTACSGSTEGGGTPAAGTADKTPEATGDTAGDAKESSGGPVEITMWGGWGGDQVTQLDAQLELFNQSQDKIRVTYAVQDAMEQKLLTAIASGEVPDVVLWDRFNTGVYAPKGALTPIDDLVERDGVDLAKFYEPAVDELIYQDQLYGIPLTVDARVLFYNKDMLAAAGVDPASIKTWDDLREAAKKCTIRENDVLTQAGFSLFEVGLFNIWTGQAGGKIVDASASPATAAFNSAEGLSVLNQWSAMLNEDKVYELGFEEGYGNDAFKAGKLAITYDGPWLLAGYNEAGLNYGVIEPVTGPKGDKATFMGGFGLAIPNQAKNKDAAWEFIKWWTTQPQNGVEFAKISENLPANKDAAADPYFAEDEILSVFTKTLEYAQIRAKVPGYSDVEGLAIIPQLQLFMAGEQTAEEALAAAEKQGNDILKEAAANQ